MRCDARKERRGKREEERDKREERGGKRQEGREKRRSGGEDERKRRDVENILQKQRHEAGRRKRTEKEKDGVEILCHS